MASIHYRTLGFVFKNIERAESDEIFTVFTSDFGRIEVLGKAIRKITSKLRSGIGLFCLSEIEFIQGKGHKTLTDAQILEKFGGIKKDIKKLKTAFEIARVLDKFLKFEEKENKIWELVVETFTRLDEASKENLQQIIFYYFLWNFFSVLGYAPEFYQCAVCRQKILSGDINLSLKDGGVICQKCARLKNGLIKTSSDIVKILRIILKKDWLTLSKIKINPAAYKLLKSNSQDYYFHIEQISGF